MKLRDIYHKAIKIIEKRGWYQGEYCNFSNGSVCLLGAIGIACGIQDENLENNEFEPNWTRATTKLNGLLHCNAAQWNDRGCRTKKDVINLLRRAANGK